MSATILPEQFIFQRCKHYGIWPGLEYRGTKTFKMPCFNGSILQEANFRVWYLAYGNLEDINKKPDEVSGDVIEFISFEQGNGFHVGPVQYSEGNAGDAFGQAKINKPKQGEVDLYISCELPEGQKVTIDELYFHIAPLMPTIVLIFSSLIGDILLAIGKPEGMQRIGMEATMSGSATGGTLLLPRPKVKADTLSRALAGCAVFSSTADRTTQLELSIAARRITSAQQEYDYVDKFCDYWEACEFLCKAPKFKPDQRLADMLAYATGAKSSILKTKIVGPLYDLRKDLVHNAVEDLDRIKRAMPILEDIASLAFNQKCGLRRAQFSGALADYYMSIQAQNAVPI